MPEPQPLAPDPNTPMVTTVEESAYKAHIEPYSAAPTMSIADGVIGCAFCTNTKFRRSRVRIHDLRELLLLRYPMRCMRCNQRQYGYFLTAALALPPRSQSARVARGNETWKAWTESERNGHSLQRPMTTSVGTRATKLQKLPSRAPAAQPSESQGRREDDRHIW
ncbi:hypothetical protein [Terriglobus sp.]|uniref:hypothetical protein n=1 Tax=Terriglobus sp. TaxID=1889013 RepID=UPI003AFF940B